MIQLQELAIILAKMLQFYFGNCKAMSIIYLTYQTFCTLPCPHAEKSRVPKILFKNAIFDT